MNLLEHNRTAWNEEVKKGNRWTLPVTTAEIEAAANGEFKIILTPFSPVPKDWLGEVREKKILCLASGGGQQGPILAAAGGQVTVFDNSEEQLKIDEQVALENDLQIQTVRGNMQDLGCFADESFDLIIHPRDLYQGATHGFERSEHGHTAGMTGGQGIGFVDLHDFVKDLGIAGRIAQ